MKDLQIQLLRNFFHKPEEIMKFNITAEIFGDSYTNVAIFDEILEKYKNNIPFSIESFLSVKKLSPKRKKRLEEIKNLKYIPNTYDIKKLILDSDIRNRWATKFQNYQERLLSGDEIDKIFEELSSSVTKDVTKINSEYKIDNLSDLVKTLDFKSKPDIKYFPYQEMQDIYMQRGELIVIAARPAMGKSLLTLDMATRQAMQGERVVFFSLEMNRNLVIKRIVSNLSKVPLQNIIKHQLTELQYEQVLKAMKKIEKFKDNFTLITEVKDWKTIMSLSKKESLIKPINYLYIDHMHELSVDRGMDENRFYGMVSSDAANLSKKLNCITIFLAQLSRECEKRDNKRPKPSDLRGSGYIEQSADMIIFPYRPYVYDTSQDSKLMEVYSAKNRSGKAFNVRLEVVLKYQKIMNKMPSDKAKTQVGKKVIPF